MIRKHIQSLCKVSLKMSSHHNLQEMNDFSLLLAFHIKKIKRFKVSSKIFDSYFFTLNSGRATSEVYSLPGKVHKLLMGLLLLPHPNVNFSYNHL